MDAYIYDAVRTPRGSARKNGSLVQVHPINLVRTLLDGLTERNTFQKEAVEEALLGCVTQIKDQGADIAKIALMNADWPDSVGGTTINRFCASGLEAVAMGATKTHAGMEEVILAGGVESVSRIPMFSDYGAWYANKEISEKTDFIQMGVSADIMANIEEFERDTLDNYAAESQKRAARARAEGYFSSSIIPIKDDIGQVILEEDELIRPDSTVELLAELNPSFEKMVTDELKLKIKDAFPYLDNLNYVHHPGNSPALADGASLLLIGNKKSATTLNKQPRAKIIACANAAANRLLLTGGQLAAEKVLQKADMAINDIDLFEYNEAFASASVKFMKDFKLDRDQYNVNGGAISMGHALGATGGILVMTALDELERRNEKRALIAISGGAGVGTAVIIERVL